MPTVNIDVTKQYENLYDKAVRNANFSGGLNPGQIATLNNLEPIITATAEVYIAGRDVEVTMEVDISFVEEVPEYISRTVENISQTIQLYSGKLESARGYDASQIIRQAFASL